jgi:hypothetical protein
VRKKIWSREYFNSKLLSSKPYFMKLYLLPAILLFSAFSFLTGCKKPLDVPAGNERAMPGKTLNKPCNCGKEEAFPEIEGETIRIPNGNSGIIIKKKGEYYVFLGDILLTEEQVEKLRNSGGSGSRTAIADFAKYWGGGIVPFTINSNLPNQVRVTDAIAHWQTNTGLRFVARTNQADYVEFIPGTGCSSFVGKKGGRQEIILEAGCGTGETIHEIGHAIGFFHEQSRADRDNSVTILWNNIQAGRQHNFQTYTVQVYPGFELGAFDFNSIMLYSSFDFSSNGQPTITTLAGNIFFAQRIGLSAGDIETSDFIYGPPFAKFRMVLVNSSDDGYTRTSDFEFYVDLFQDQACTIPVNLANDRTMVANKIVKDYNSGQWYTTSDNAYGVFMTAGNNSFLIGTASNYEQYSEYNGEVTIYSGHSEYCYTREAFLR